MIGQRLLLLSRNPGFLRKVIRHRSSPHFLLAPHPRVAQLVATHHHHHHHHLRTSSSSSSTSSSNNNNHHHARAAVDQDDNDDKKEERQTPRYHRSFVAEKAAARNFESMRNLVDDLTTNNHNTGATTATHSHHHHHHHHPAAQFRSAFLYWLSRSTKITATKLGMPDLPAESAQRILDYLLLLLPPKDGNNKESSSNKQQLLEFVVMGHNNSRFQQQQQQPNSGFCRLMHLYLRPLQGTNAWISQVGHRQQQQQQQQHRLSVQQQEETMLDCLYKASKVCNIMQSLHNDPCYSNLRPDRASSLSILKLWSRRCKFLSWTKYHHSVFNDNDWNNNNNEKVSVALGGATNAQECIDAMQRFLDESKTRHDLPEPTDEFYSILLSSLAYSSRGDDIPQAADQAHQILKQLQLQQKEKEESESSSDAPQCRRRRPLSLALYTAVLLAYDLQTTSNNDSVIKAVSLWNEMKRTTTTYNQNPTTSFAYHPITMSLLLKILGKAGRPEEAQAALESMEATAAAAAAANDDDDDDTGGSFPTRIHYNIVLSAWAKSHSVHAPDKAEALLHRMMDLGVATTRSRKDVLPDRISYTAVMECMLRNSSPANGIDRAETILTSCEETEHESAMPDNVTYLTFLRGLRARQRQEAEAQVKEAICIRMEGILRRMQNRSKKRLPFVNEPETDIYNLCLDAWAHSHSTLAASRALALMQEMESNHVKPDVTSYELVLKCFCIKPEAQSVQDAQKLLHKMNEKGITQTIAVFNQYLRILAKTGAVQQAERIVMDTESSFRDGQGDLEPNESSYFALIEGYARTDNGAHNADRVLRQMQDLARNRGRSNVQPSISAFATVMEAWGKSNELDAVERVEELFEEIRTVAKPNSYIYGTYMSALNRSRRLDAPQRIEEVLQLMQQDYETGKNSYCQPSASNFAIAINCWATSRQEGAAERAEAILNRMVDLHHHSPEYHHMKPTAACYKGAILAWALSDHHQAAERALALLDRMEGSNHLKSRSTSAVLPNRPCYLYTTVAIGKSNDPQKAEKIRRVLQRMESSYKEGNRHARPNAEIYQTALRGIGTVTGSWEERAAAFVLAQETLSDYLKSTTPDQQQSSAGVFVQFLWACYKLVPAGKQRDEIVQQTSASCPASMMESPAVLSALHRVVSPAAHKAIVWAAKSLQK